MFKKEHILRSILSNEVTTKMAKSLTVREKKAAKFAVLNLKNDTLTVCTKNGSELAVCKKDHEKRGAFQSFFGAHKFKLGESLLFIK